MAYATIPNTNSTRTPSPGLPGQPHTPLSTTFEHLSNSLFSDQSLAQSKLSVSGVLKSITSSQHSSNSYELVEDDDYDHAPVTPKVPKNMSQTTETESHESPNEIVPVRTASISRNLPLHNPTPDLQSLQGAYLKNVERLEDTAARLSLAESLEEEMKRKRSGSHRQSSSHSRDGASNDLKRQFSGQSRVLAIDTRSAGYSTAGYIPSPVGSVTSRKRSLQQEMLASRHSQISTSLPEPEFEGRPLESATVQSPLGQAFQPRHSSDSRRFDSMHSSIHDRPGTSASNDTYRQAQHLFTDFDGTHVAYHNNSTSRRISLTQPPLARDSKAFKEPQPGEKMVYYPAPVPVMLNLPKRLSRGDWAIKEKRRTQALSQIPAAMRKSAAWLANVDSEAELDSNNTNNRQSNMPAQLRASAFFDSPGVRTDVKLKDGSAVKTLDSILDAAAHAPVSAFTDHPIVGHLGSEVYGPEPKQRKKSSEVERRRKSSLSNVLHKRKSSDNLSAPRRLSQVIDNEVEMADDDPEKLAEKSIAPGEDEIENGEGEHAKGEESSEEEEEHQLGFLSAPTTLLAELQMRKAQQKSRNKTAADAFPGGMHSTLLELDAVAQLQQKSRKMKHIALAWEDQDAVEKTNFDDEDVPLAVLFPEKNQSSLANMHRPVGLMERREMEENEPLGQRRARLRGEVYQPRPTLLEHQSETEGSAPMLKVDGIDEVEEEIEGETLAQRVKRMKDKKDKKPSSLADDIASQLGLNPEHLGGTKTPEVGEAEETLGQRRKRLQAEAEKAKLNGNTALKTKISMGDLLSTHPTGPPAHQRQATRNSNVSLLMNQTPSPYFTNPYLTGHGMPFGQSQQTPASGQGVTNGFTPYSTGLPQHPPPFSQTHMTMPGVQAMPFMPLNGGYLQNPYSNQFMNMSGTNLGVNKGGFMNHPMPNPYLPGHGVASAYDIIGMGPPLDSQQRATIDQWRQGVA